MEPLGSDDERRRLITDDRVSQPLGGVREGKGE